MYLPKLVKLTPCCLKGTIIDVPIDIVQHVFDANFFAVLRVIKAVFPHMAKRKSGTIVNVGSVVGEMCVSTSY